MTKLKSNLTNMLCVLTGISVICGGLLAYIYDLTKTPIDEANSKALSDGITAVMGGGSVKVEAPDTIKRTIDGKELTYIVYKTDKGTAVQSTDPNGFGGNLTILVGFNEGGEILGYTVLENNETPGLGAKCPDWFQKGAKGDIIGKDPKNELKVKQDGGEVDAITASTITSRSFLRAVNQAYCTLQEMSDGNTGATKQNK
ncbi:MAG: RnfABCDGE type electron transport complex subunit G [Prevotella sp.]|nr:RnfABCDGE type electron transport complex subunit G [Prevotella sp.]